MKLGSHESSDNKVMSNLFAELFSSTYSSSTFNINSQNNIPEEKTFDLSFIDQCAVFKYIQQLKSLHTAGPAGFLTVLIYSTNHLNWVIFPPFGYNHLKFYYLNLLSGIQTI